MKLFPYYLGLTVLGIGANSSPVLAQGADILNEALLKRIEELEQRLKIAERKDELEHESALQKAKTSATASIGAGGFEIHSADTNFVLRLHGYVQADSRWYVNDNNTPVNDTFLLRRVRPILEGTVWDKFDYRLMLDFGSGVTSSSANDAYVQDAYVNARLWPEFQIQAGKFKEPVSLERIQSGANLLFVERSYPSQLAPNRDVGIQIHGSVLRDTLVYEIGYFNGVADGGSGDIDASDDDKDFVGRIFAEPFKNSENEALRGIGVGIAGTWGDHDGTPRGYVSPGQQSIFSYYTGTGTNAVTVSAGKQWRLIPQAYYYWRSLGVFAEYAISAPELKRTGGGQGGSSEQRLEHTAWQVAASYFLSGEDNSFKAVSPKHPFSLHGDGWGAWEIAARASQFKLDKDTFPNFANPNTSAREAFSEGFGLNWHLNRNFKLNLDYEHASYSGGKGNPLLAKDENIILTRAQITF
jgi:phosphate-selective porin OprO/OprP